MAGFPTVEAQAAQSRHGGSMRSKKGPSVFCRPTGGAAEQGGGHEGVVGSIARRCGLVCRASRAAPSRLQARRLRHPSFVDRQVCSPGPALGPLAPVLHTTHVLTRDAAPDLLHRQVVDGVMGDNGQPGRIGCPPARPTRQRAESRTTRITHPNRDGTRTVSERQREPGESSQKGRASEESSWEGE